MTVKVAFHPVKGSGVIGHSFELECDHCHETKLESDIFYVVVDRMLRDLVEKATLAGFVHKFVDGKRMDVCPSCCEAERKIA